jgi:hypothetical protein
VNKRRYACLANYVRGDGAERLLIEEIGLTHPLLDLRLPQHNSIASAFDWFAQRRPLSQKYGDATADLRSLWAEVSGLMEPELRAVN